MKKALIIGLVLCLFLINFVSANYEKYEWYDTGDDNFAQGYSIEWKGQIFKVGTTGSNTEFSIDKISLKLFRIGGPGTIIVSIREVDSDGIPTGEDLTNGTIDGNMITAINSGQWYDITMSPAYTLHPDTSYSIIVRAPFGSKYNSFKWIVDTSLPGYLGGSLITSGDNGVTWSFESSVDTMFEVWGHPTPDLDGDGISGRNDNCPNNYNPNQEDEDLDGLGNVCDNCIYNYNPNQTDTNGNGIGEACDFGVNENLTQRISDLEAEVIELREELENQKTLIDTIRITLDNFINRIMNYFTHLQQSQREYMLCNILKETGNVSIDDLGLHCQIVEGKNVLRNKRSICVCNVI